MNTSTQTRINNKISLKPISVVKQARDASVLLQWYEHKTNRERSLEDLCPIRKDQCSNWALDQVGKRVAIRDNF